jgi:hypothetical protein
VTYAGVVRRPVDGWPVQAEENAMKTMTCPCGEALNAYTDDEFVAVVNQHMEKAHPEMAGKYTPEQILSRAQEV